MSDILIWYLWFLVTHMVTHALGIGDNVLATYLNFSANGELARSFIVTTPDSSLSSS